MNRSAPQVMRWTMMVMFRRRPRAGRSLARIAKNKERKDKELLSLRWRWRWQRDCASLRLCSRQFISYCRHHTILAGVPYCE